MTLAPNSEPDPSSPEPAAARDPALQTNAFLEPSAETCGLDRTAAPPDHWPDVAGYIELSENHRLP